MSEVEERLRKSQSVAEHRHWQVLLLLMQGQGSGEVSRTVGYSVGWVRQLVGRYNTQGCEAVGDGRGANPGARPLVDEALREELRALLAEPVPAALGGGLWNGVKVAVWLQERLGRPVHRQRGQEALQALGYSCQVPRPRHAKADPQQQEAFKKSWRKE